MDLVFLPTILKSRSSRSKSSSSSIISALFGNVNVISFYIHTNEIWAGFLWPFTLVEFHEIRDSIPTTLVELLMQRKHLHHQQTIHNNELKNGKNPHFQSSFTLFFLYIYTLGCKDNHMAFLSPVDWKNPSATSCWDKTHNQDNFL